MEPVSSTTNMTEPNAVAGAAGNRVAVYQRPPLLSAAEVAHMYPHRYMNVHEPSPEDYIGKPTIYEARTSFFLCRSFLSIFDWSAVVVVCLSIGLTVLCMRQAWATDMPLTLLAAGIVFPISFLIANAASRRERTLLDVASLKASLVCFYSITRDWNSAFTHSKRNYANDCRAIMRALVEDMAMYVEHRAGKERLVRIYQSFDQLSKVNEGMRREEDWVKSILGVTLTMHRTLVEAFERVRVTHDYRNNSSLRSYAFMFLYFVPLGLSPLFANYGRLYGHWAGIFISIISGFMVAALYRVMVVMEDPFDDIGADDLNLGVLSETLKHMLP